MRRVLSVAMALMIVVGVAAPASAGGHAERGGPAAYCRSAYQEMTNPVSGMTFYQYVVPVEFSFGGETVVEDFGLSSFQACVSTVASGMKDGVIPASAITTPAYLAQCDFLEDAGVIAYPYAFYGMYPADNRADCVRILKGVHSGELPLPEPPPVG